MSSRPLFSRPASSWGRCATAVTAMVATALLPVALGPASWASATPSCLETIQPTERTFTPTGCDDVVLDLGSVRFEPAPDQPGRISEDGKVLTVPGEGVHTVDAKGTLTFLREAAFSGAITPVRYTVTDMDGFDDSSTLTLVVRPATPVASDDTATTLSDTPVELTGATDDTAGSDDGGTPGDPVDDTTVPLRPGLTVFAAAPQPEDSTLSEDRTALTLANQGTWTIRPDGSVRFAPVDSFTGTTASPTYRVEDAEGNRATANLTVTVRTAPTAREDAAVTTPGATASVRPLRNDSAGQELDGASADLDPTSLVLVDSPDGRTLLVAGQGTYRVDRLARSITFDPLAGFDGVASPAGYAVTDSLDRTVRSTVTVTVEPVAPITPITPAAVGEVPQEAAEVSTGSAAPASTTKRTTSTSTRPASGVSPGLPSAPSADSPSTSSTDPGTDTTSDGSPGTTSGLPSTAPLGTAPTQTGTDTAPTAGPSDGVLPGTGGPPVTPLAAGLALLAGGLVLMRRGRRSETS